MTYEQYIQNPMGIANSVISNREMYRQNYAKRWDIINLRENGEIKYKLYKADKGIYYAYIKVPSEAVRNFYYDVLIKFMPPKDTAKAIGNSLKDYEVQFYSNDPAFVYTFAHAFIKNNLFIKELAHKMSREAIRRAASEKNPGNQVGYVKSLYFAFLIMNRRGLFNKLKYVNKLYMQELNENIMHADQKIEERQEAGHKSKKANYTAKELMSGKHDAISQAKALAHGVSTTKIVNRVKHKVGLRDNKIKNVKTTKKI